MLRRELAQLRSELDAQREGTYRALAGIQSQLMDLDRTLSLASDEIWGDGSPTGARLSMARGTLTAVQAEVDDLSRQVLRATLVP